MNYYNRSESLFKPSYFHKCSTEPLLPWTIGKLIDWAAEQWIDDEAVVYSQENIRMSFKEVREKADAIASGLLALGLKPGDVLAVLGFNSSVIYLMSVAVQRAGLIATYIDPFKKAEQVLSCLKKVKAKAFVIRELKGEEEYYKELLTTVLEQSTSTKGNVHKKELPDLKIVITSSDTLHPGTFDWKQVYEMSTTDGVLQKINNLQNSIQPDDVAVILFTSGTTSDPKAVLISHHMLVNNSYFTGKSLGFKNYKHRVLFLSYLGHIGSMLMPFLTGFHFGLPAIYVNGKFTADSTIQILEKERCSLIFCTPNFIIDMIIFAKDNQINLHYPEVILTYGAAISKTLVREIKKMFPLKYLMTTYGMTECGSLTLNLDVENSSLTSGRLLDHLEVKIVDDKGNMVPMQMPGELWIRSTSLMKGYLDDKEMTEKVVTPSGWFKTRDECVLEGDGTWKFIGRINDRINKLSWIIYPLEIESVLLSLDGIQNACVFGAPDERSEEEICAFIKTKRGKTLSENDITKFCEGKLDFYKIPKYIRFIEEFPKTTIGKVNKRALLDIIVNDKDYIQNSTSLFGGMNKK